MKIVSLACVALLVGACTRPTEQSCVAGLQAAIRLTVVDSVSGAPAASGSTVVAVRNGFDSESVTTPAGAPYDASTISAGSLPGAYTLTVQKATYATWTRDVDVPSVNSQCRQPLTATLQARLKKL